MTYFVGLLNEGDVLAHAQWPLQVNFILIEGEEEDNEDKEGIDEVEEKGNVVLELHEAAGQHSLNVHVNRTENGGSL
jgi:hypothetical protein